MRLALYAAALTLTACASVPPPEPPPAPVDPTVYHDFRIVPRSPDVALYPAASEHVWVPVAADRVFVTVKVINYPAQRPTIPPPAVAVATAPQQTTARPSPPPPPARVPSVFTAEIRFAFDKHSLDSKAKQEIEQLAQRVGQSLASAEIVVEGFTDSQGSDSYNQKLSARRANAVRDYLVSKGASPALVAVSGRGESAPVSSNATEQGRSLNRRATVQVTSD